MVAHLIHQRYAVGRFVPVLPYAKPEILGRERRNERLGKQRINDRLGNALSPAQVNRGDLPLTDEPADGTGGQPEYPSHLCDGVNLFAVGFLTFHTPCPFPWFVCYRLPDTHYT